jgi:hypothetical protein
MPRCLSKRFSTWYKSACSEGKPHLISIIVYHRSLRYVGDISRYITSGKKLKDRFQGNSRTKERLGFCRFTGVYASYIRDKKIHT